MGKNGEIKQKKENVSKPRNQRAVKNLIILAKTRIPPSFRALRLREQSSISEKLADSESESVRKFVACSTRYIDSRDCTCDGEGSRGRGDMLTIAQGRLSGPIL